MTQQLDTHTSTLLWPTFYRDVTAVGVHDGLGYRQANPCAIGSVRPSTATAQEALKNQWQLIGINADTFVLDLNLHGIGMQFELHANHTSAWRVANRIVQNDHKGLSQAFCVGGQSQRCRHFGHRQLHFHFLVSAQSVSQLGRVLQQRGQVDWFQANQEWVGLSLGDEQQIVDSVCKMLCPINDSL